MPHSHPLFVKLWREQGAQSPVEYRRDPCHLDTTNSEPREGVHRLFIASHLSTLIHQPDALLDHPYRIAPKIDLVSI